MTVGADRSAYDSQQLGVLDDLLTAAARRLNVRDLFYQLSAVGSRLIPYDEIQLVVSSEGLVEECRYASTRDGAAAVITDPPEENILERNEPQLLDTLPGPDRGLGSGLRVPVRVDGRPVGTLALFSRRPQTYSPDDIAHAQRLANYLSVGLVHQRLAEKARDAVVERQRSADIEACAELLRTISDVLDIRTVFPRISEIAKKMLPHDALAMVFTDQGRHFVRQAVSPDDFPDPPVVTFKTPLPDDFIYADLSVGPLLPLEPADAFAPIIAAGYRSVLTVRIPAREQHITLAFWSKRPGAFEQRDLPVARRIADYIALSVSHEQLAEAVRQVADARARAERLEARVEMLSEELEAKTRIVGESAEWKDVLKRATQVAETDTTVLVTGESGTGKEIVARFIHRASARSKGPFVALNCAALPEQLLESELFGYERGAFTSAHQAKPGQIELAAGGCCFWTKSRK
jgi:GAF domain-containing protein